VSKPSKGKKVEKTPAAKPAVEPEQKSEVSAKEQTKPQAEAALNAAEEMKLEQFENVIKQGLGGFMLVGKALKAIRDERLYRVKFKKFEDYCREKWGLSDKYAHRLIKAYDVVMNLQSKFENSPIGEIRLPTNESQVRPLTALEKPEQQVKAWQKVLKSCEGKPITADDVEAVVTGMVGHPAKPAAEPNTELNEANNRLAKIGELVAETLEEDDSELTVASLKQVLEQIQKLLGAEK